MSRGRRPGPDRRAGRDRRARRDRGSFTAELAAGLPALMLLLFAGLTAVNAVTAKAQCVDAAREAALAAARGEGGLEAGQRIAPPGSTVSIATWQDTVVVTVKAPVRSVGRALPGTAVTATAVAALEPSAPEVTP